MTDKRHRARRRHRGNFMYLFAALLLFAIGASVLEVSLPTLGGLFAEVSLSLMLVSAYLSDTRVAAGATDETGNRPDAASMPDGGALPMRPTTPAGSPALTQDP